jgi:galactose mutarotase-like enzyme
MQIENAILRVNAKLLGAELVSIFDKRDNTEHLWQGNPAYWAAHAPILFPIVGRCNNDTLSFNGKKYKMEKHGFARRNEFHLIAQTEDSMCFELCSNEHHKQMYPFDFSFRITYSLQKHALLTTYTIENRSNTEMPFAIGGHPAFAVPFFEGDTYEDYAIEFSNDTTFLRHHINNDGLFDGRTSQVNSMLNQIPLHRNLFNEDALIFKDLLSKAVGIVSHKHNKKLQMNFEGFPYLGIWAKPGADYVCLEPWIGCADAEGFQDDFTKKEKVVILQSGEVSRFSFNVVLEKVSI